MQNLHSMPSNRNKRDHVHWFAPDNSSKLHQPQAKSSSTPSKGKHPSKHNATRSHILKAAAAAVATAKAVAPIERINILMQCQDELIKAGRLSSPYKGLIDCFLRTINHEGLLSLWRGYSLHVIRLCLLQVQPFALAYVPYAYGSYMNKKMHESPIWILPFAAVPALSWYYPLDFARTRLACNVNESRGLKFSMDPSTKSLGNGVNGRQFSGAFDVFKKTLKSEGICGLYRGFSVSCIGLTAYHTASHWFQVPSMKAQGNEVSKEKPTRWSMSPWLGGYLIWTGLNVAFYPVRTVSRRMMMTSGEANKYKGAVDAINQIVRTEGVSSLFKGLSVYLMYNVARSTSMAMFLKSLHYGLAENS